jgi:4-amino-4-deoxy-L-arabinose transferase-like glycosyltransferase
MSKAIKLLPYLSDIRFWIIMLFILRLYGITNPPLEVAHNWRQATVVMVARNFYELDANIFYPKLDFAGNKSGIAGMEFPILNYLIYLMSLLFGYADWYGRLINLSISSLGVWYFFKLIKNYFSKELAFNASIILLFSIWIIYARKIMPDTFATSLAIISIYYGTKFFEKKGVTNLMIYIILAILAFLSKLPIGFIFIVFLLFIGSKTYSLSTKVIFGVVSLLIFPFPYWWYFNWVPYLNETYGFDHFFMGKSLFLGAVEIWGDLDRFAFRFYDTALKYVGFLMFIIGLGISIVKKNKKLLFLFSLSFTAFMVVVFKSGLTFLMHSYYMVPFVPIMAVFAAYGLSQLKNKRLTILILFAIVTEGILNNQDDFRVPHDNLAIVNLEKNLNRYIEFNDLILINSEPNPTPMYFAHRKGWLASNKQINNPDFISNLKQKGLRYIVILKKSFGENSDLNNELVFENEDYKLYKV